MKKTISIAFALIFALTSCVRLGDLGLEPVPDIAFVYECNGGLEYTFTSTVEGTEDISWNVLDVTTGTGETFVCTFPSPGTYWVQMTGTYNGRVQTVSTKILVAKAAKIVFGDDSLDDWDNVTYPDFVFTGGSYEEMEKPILLESKFDYDAISLYFYVQFDASARADIDADRHRLDVFLDVDGNASTGVADFDDRLGIEYILQMHIFNEDSDCYGIDVMDGNWDGVSNGDELAGSLVAGHRQQDGNIVRMEFSIPRSTWGVTGTAFGMGLKIENSDWTDFDALQDSEGNQGLILDLNKME